MAWLRASTVRALLNLHSASISRMVNLKRWLLSAIFQSWRSKVCHRSRLVAYSKGIGARIGSSSMLSDRGEPGSLVGTRMSMRDCIRVPAERFTSDHDYNNDYHFCQSPGCCGRVLRPRPAPGHSLANCAGCGRCPPELSARSATNRSRARVGAVPVSAAADLRLGLADLLA